MKTKGAIYKLEIKYKIEKKIEYNVIRKFDNFKKMNKFIDAVKKMLNKEIEQIKITKEFLYEQP